MAVQSSTAKKTTKKTAAKKPPVEVKTSDATIPGDIANDDTALMDLAALLDAEEPATPAPAASPLDSLLDECVARNAGVEPAIVDEPTLPAPVASKPETKAKPAENQPAAPVAPRPPVHAKTSEKITHRLGQKVNDFMVLETSDAGLPSEQLDKLRAAVLKEIDDTKQIKVREKMVQLFNYMANGGKLNEVMRRAFTVLIKDGQLTSGDKGNLQLDLLKKPYSIGTSRAQAGQIFSLFPILKIVHKTSERGVYKANEESTILAFMKGQLAL